MKTEKKSFLHVLFAYAGSERKKMVSSIVLSILSVMTELLPFYCMYRMIRLFTADAATAGEVVRWCLLALSAVPGKYKDFIDIRKRSEGWNIAQPPTR